MKIKLNLKGNNSKRNPILLLILIRKQVIPVLLLILIPAEAIIQEDIQVYFIPTQQYLEFNHLILKQKSQLESTPLIKKGIAFTLERMGNGQNAVKE